MGFSYLTVHGTAPELDPHLRRANEARAAAVYAVWTALKRAGAAAEWRDDAGTWFRAHGNENWEFAADGLMRRRIASINDLPIAEADRNFRWPQGRRPDEHPGLSDLGL